MEGVVLTEQLQAAGWRQRSLSGFIETAGPLWTRKEAQGWAYGFLVEEQHLNNAGVVHGGALLTLLDHALSAVAWEHAERSPCVTVQLDSQFLSPVRPGDFVESRTRVLRRTRQLLFMQGELTAGDSVVLSAQGILKVVTAIRTN